jgi:hypothetical protein
MSYNLQFAEALEELLSRCEKFNDHRPLWDILTGLRGADQLTTGDSLEGREKLDHLTNHRVRYFVGIYPPRQADKAASYNSTPLTDEEQELREKLLESKAPEHFEEHYEAAVQGIRKLYQYDLEKEESLDGSKSPKRSYRDGEKRGYFG